MRKISVDSNAEKHKLVAVYWDSEWQEYQVRLYVKGELIADATYYTDDRGMRWLQQLRWLNNSSATGAQQGHLALMCPIYIIILGWVLLLPFKLKQRIYNETIIFILTSSNPNYKWLCHTRFNHSTIIST